MIESPAVSRRIIDEVASWPGVETGRSERGGLAFTLGRWEIGHLHGDHAVHFSFPRELWAQLRKQGRIVPHPVIVSAHTTRVPVINGHTETISVQFNRRPSLQDLMAAFRGFSGRPQQYGCPSAPRHPLQLMEELNRPQPRLDVEREGGMAVFLGRVRPCPVFDYKFVALGHNTVRGAAGAAVLNAELMLAEKLID